jgi:hypothetical protein
MTLAFMLDADQPAAPAKAAGGGWLRVRVEQPGVLPYDVRVRA